MHDNYWNWGMGWGMWIIPLVVITVVLFFIKSRRKK